MTIEQVEHTEERFHPDDEVNAIMVTMKRGMGLDPSKFSSEYIKKLEAFVQEDREKRERKEQPTAKE